MSGLLTTLIMVGVLVGGAYVMISPERRCEYLGLCGQEAVAAAPVEEAVAETPDEPSQTGGSKGCCQCEMKGDRVKCLRNNTGDWFNPPAGEGGSNDSDVNLSLVECNKGCGGTNVDPKANSDNDKNDDGSRDNSPTSDEDIKNYNSRPTLAQNPKTNNYRTVTASKPNTFVKSPQTTTSSGKVIAAKDDPQWAKMRTSIAQAKAKFANAFMTGDGRYAYYPNMDDFDKVPLNEASSNFSEIITYKIDRPPKAKKQAPYYVRGNRVYSL